MLEHLNQTSEGENGMTKSVGERIEKGRQTLMSLFYSVSSNRRAFYDHDESLTYTFIGGKRKSHWPAWLRDLQAGAKIHVLAVTPLRGLRTIVVAIAGTTSLLDFPRECISKLQRK